MGKLWLLKRANSKEKCWILIISVNVLCVYILETCHAAFPCVCFNLTNCKSNIFSSNIGRRYRTVTIPLWAFLRTSPIIPNPKYQGFSNLAFYVKFLFWDNFRHWKNYKNSIDNSHMLCVQILLLLCLIPPVSNDQR